MHPTKTIDRDSIPALIAALLPGCKLRFWSNDTDDPTGDEESLTRITVERTDGALRLEIKRDWREPEVSATASNEVGAAIMAHQVLKYSELRIGQVHRPHSGEVN